jgi:MFS family permease
LFYVYPPNDRLGRDPSLVIDELTLVGTILGMLVMGHLADRSGRKKWYGAELAILIVATMGMVQSSEGLMAENGNGPDRSMSIYSWVSWWRFLLGFGIGAEVSNQIMKLFGAIVSLQSLLVSSLEYHHCRVGIDSVPRHYAVGCVLNAVFWTSTVAGSQSRCPADHASELGSQR